MGGGALVSATSFSSKSLPWYRFRLHTGTTVFTQTSAFCSFCESVLPTFSVTASLLLQILLDSAFGRL
uniref:Uncharacterized protein n=1 Tax=Arundo donax TaxID=35708 RepID=A0A0A9CBD4_ARUDO